MRDSGSEEKNNWVELFFATHLVGQDALEYNNSGGCFHIKTPRHHHHDQRHLERLVFTQCKLRPGLCVGIIIGLQVKEPGNKKVPLYTMQ